MSPDTPALAIEGLSFSYAGSDECVLADITVSVPRGAFALLVGDTGSGKSTLLSLVKPQIAPAGERAGSVRAFGREVGGLTDEEAATTVGFVFQDPDNQVVCDSVWPRRVRARVRSRGGRVDGRGGGHHGGVRVPGPRQPGGMRQRVARDGLRSGEPWGPAGGDAPSRCGGRLLLWHGRLVPQLHGRALRRAQAAEMRRRVAEAGYFFGMGDWFHSSTDELSGGRKQLLALASTLVMQPRRLMLDEPTAQLDPIATKTFLHALFRVNRELGCTVVVATHAPELMADYATCAFELEGGRLREVDSPRRAHGAARSHRDQELPACALPRQPRAGLHRRGGHARAGAHGRLRHLRVRTRGRPLARGRFARCVQGAWRACD